MSRTIRSLIVLLVGGAVLLFVLQKAADTPGLLVPKDFAEYWTAGRLNLHGDNPYDPEKLLAEQQLIEPNRREALMMWNPPPALALYMPLGLFPFRLAGLLWVGIQLLSVMLACDLLWRQYSPQGKRWPAHAIGVMFVGTWWLVSFGQNSGFLLLGLAGYLHFTQKDRPLAAGACAALTALKPHLLLGFGVLLLAEAVSRKGRLTLLSGVSVIALSLGIAVLANPEVIGEYLKATSTPVPGAIPLYGWKLPVPSYWLRVGIAGNDLSQNFWIQFVPAALGCAALLLWRFLSGEEWNWPRALPWVVAISVLTAPYGWIFDFTVLLVPAIWAASRLVNSQSWSLLGVFLIGLLVVNVVTVAFVWALHDFWWVTPSVIGLCLLGCLGPRPSHHVPLEKLVGKSM
jgi:hypothetical protein